jgi:thiol:disulfide interchange protein DsbD
LRNHIGAKRLGVRRQRAYLAAMQVKGIFLAGLMAAGLTFGTAGAQQSRPRMADSSLVSAQSAIAPGETFTVALRQQMREGWHTYWRNPGDAGEAVKFTWSLPSGFSAAPNEWPLPQVHKTGPITDFIYEGAVLLPLKMTAPADLPVGKPVELAAHIAYLVCQDICIPEEADVSLRLEVAKTAKDDAEWAPRIEASRASVPKPAAGLVATIKPAGAAYQFTARGAALMDVREPYFLPFAPDRLDHAAAQPAKIEGDKITLTLTPTVGGKPTDAPIAGVLAFKTRAGARGIEIDTGEDAGAAASITPEEAAPSAVTPAPSPVGWIDGALGLAAALGFAAWAFLRRKPKV